MKPIHIKFFKERTKEIMTFVAAIDEFRRVLRTKISDLKSLMDMSRCSNVKLVPVKAAKALNVKSIDARLRYEITLTRGPEVELVKVRVFAVISADGWKFQFNKFGPGCTRDELRALLHRCFPQGFAIVKDGNAFVEAKTFPFDEEMPKVQAHYEHRISTLATEGSAALQET